MKRIVLVGMSEDTRDMVPWDELEPAPETEVWVVNEMGDTDHPNYSWIQRWDRCFQMHPRWDFTREHNYNHVYYWEWLQEQDGSRPTIMQEAFEDVPGAEEFPLENLLEQGTEMGDRFTCSLAYQLALVVYLRQVVGEPIERVDLYGYSMGSDTEYRYQRDSVMFWLGVFEGLYWTTGSPEVFIPEKSKLHPKWFRRYGYDGTQLIAVETLKQRRDMWRRVASRYKPKFEALHQQVVEQAHAGNNEAVEELSDERSGEFQRYWAAHSCAQENDYWLKAGVPVPRQHFELRNNSWMKEHEKAKLFLNIYATDARRLEREIKEIASRKKGLKEKKNKELAEIVRKQETQAQKLIYSGAVLEENKRWIRHCDMIEAGFEPDQDSDIVPKLQLRYIPEEESA